MNYHYCQSCFKKTPQTADIIKFCSHCGKPFIEASASELTLINNSSNHTASQPKQTLRDKFRERLDIKHNQLTTDDNDDDESDDNYTEVTKVPELNGQELEVDIPQERGITIGNVAKGAKRQPRPKSAGNKKVKLDKKQFWAQYQKEASAIRPNKNK